MHFWVYLSVGDSLLLFFRGKKSSGKKLSYFKRLTEKFESMSMSEKEQVRQQQLEDMKAFISTLHSVRKWHEFLEQCTLYDFI